MNTTLKKLLLVAFALLLLVSVTACAVAQAANDTAAQLGAPVLDSFVPMPVGTVPYVDNDTAVRGAYTPFEPKEDADTYSGIAIEGNEEEELQQERIAGGAVGEATSVLEPLHGITDYSEGEYVPVYGID